MDWIFKKNFLLIILLITIVISFLLFANGISGKFVLDDSRSIFPSPHARGLQDIPLEFFKSFLPFQSWAGLYRPLVQISFILNLVISQQTGFFHVVNILLHALNTWLLFILVSLFFKSKRLAYISAGLFMFLPIHVEAVTYISGRSDLLALFFGLLAIIFFYLKKYWFSGLAFLLAVLSKEVAVGLFPLILFWSFTLEKSSFITRIKKIIPFLVSAVVYAALRMAALGSNFVSNDNAFIANPLVIACRSSRILTSFRLVAVYIWKMFLPFNLSADYSYAQNVPVTSFFDPGFIVGLSFVVILIWLVFKNRDLKSPLAFGAALFLALYFAISNFVFPIGTIMADRLVYAASAGLVIIPAFFIDKLLSLRFKNFVYCLFGLLLIVYGVVIVRRNLVWLNEEALLTSMATDSPKSINVEYNLGVYLVVHGQIEEGRPLLIEANSLIEKSKEELKCGVDR